MRVRTLLLLLAIAAIVAVSIRIAWPWLITTDEARYYANRRSISSRIGLTGIRVLHWGGQAGQRHGPFRVEIDGFEVEGAYRMGERSGRWWCWDAEGVLQWEAYHFADGELGPIRVGPALVERSPRGQWRVSDSIARGWIHRPYPSAVFVIPTSEGRRVTIGELDEPFYAPSTTGVFFEYDASGRLTLIGDLFSGERDGLWTWFAANGRPTRQVVYLLGDELDVRDEGPWYDVDAGLNQQIFHPVTGKWVELPVER